jgi:hypothetical protein
VKFWKKEFVGSGVERSAGEKKREGSGRTVDWIRGKRNGWRCSVRCGGGSDMIGVSGGGGDGDGDGRGVGGLCLGGLIKVMTFRFSFFNVVRQSMSLK